MYPFLLSTLSKGNRDQPLLLRMNWLQALPCAFVKYQLLLLL